jgi:hypothetical protein
MYVNDPKWNPSNYTAINVSTQPLALERACPVINQFDLPRSRHLGAHWAESEAIYNYYLNDLHRGMDFVGFIHYDMELRLRGWRLKRLVGSRSITQRINDWVADRESGHISFETHSPAGDYGQRIMADFDHTEVLVGDGVNCYDKILADYNEYSKSTRTLAELLRRPKINLCSSFLVDTPTFVRMMRFFDWVVSTRDLDALDQSRRHRLQGGLAERYLGVFLLFEYPTLTDMSLVHHNLKGDR